MNHCPLSWRQLFGIALLVTIMFTPLATTAAPARDGIIAGYAEQAKKEPGWPHAFSPERGRALFLSHPGSGKPETPSCTSCHGDTPLDLGQTRAGKPIEPMAVSITPDRYTDIEKVEKWFLRNCTSVLGRVCTPLEKGDFLTFMSTQ